MDSSEKKQILKILNDLISKTQNDIENLKNSFKPVSPDPAIGRLTRMEAISENNVIKANLNSAELKLERLDDAFKRIDDEDFGVCRKCDEDIPIKRMKIMPESTICVACLESPEE